MVSHSLSGLILVAQRFDAHEPGGCIDKEPEVAVSVRILACDGPGGACGDDIEGLGGLLLLCCGGVMWSGGFADDARYALPFQVLLWKLFELVSSFCVVLPEVRE